ncbi:MAG: hypothetical protein DCF18_14630 [Cyanobium sp.]|nr:MAG: hypothetical protein DCF18_14630 [Cyanobium sp.]
MPSRKPGSLPHRFLMVAAASVLLAPAALPAGSATQAMQIQTEFLQHCGEPIQVEGYILAPGDVLELRMLHSSAQPLGGSLEILSDGTASLALIGSAKLSGLTLSQAERWLTQLYKQVLLRPELTLRIVRMSPCLRRG